MRYALPSYGSLVARRGGAMAAVRRARSTIAKHEAIAGTVIKTAEVGAAAFVCGVVQGKYPGKDIFGLPIDLTAGLALHILGFAGVGGRYASHMHAFGDGALASYLVSVGKDVGKTAKWLPGSNSSGVDGVGGISGGASLADEELARMVRAGR
jgi:hypothetical protein